MKRIYPKNNHLEKTDKILSMKPEWNYQNVRRIYLKNLNSITKKDFLETEENFKKLDLIVNYLVQDEIFFKSPLIVMRNESKPSFEKGLLLIGGVGTGKSASLKAMSMTLELIPFLRTTYHLASDLVSQFEEIDSPFTRKCFNDKFRNGRRIFDDITREKMASNFGKTNLMAEIFTYRYEYKKITHVAMNFRNDSPNNFDLALNQIGIKYGDFIYDRFFDMFNIIEFPGLSMRN